MGGTESEITFQVGSLTSFRSSLIPKGQQLHKYVYQVSGVLLFTLV
jgi:hypothetical protein